MNRREFLQCHTCIHCYNRVSRDMAHVNISLCDKFRWPTYKMDCPHYERAKWHDGHHLESYLGELELLENESGEPVHNEGCLQKELGKLIEEYRRSHDGQIPQNECSELREPVHRCGT